jgi:hypothetical protein
MNKIYTPTTGPEDWKPLLADPKHWRKGYSAMSLAYCWQVADGFPEPIQKVFNDSDIALLHNIKMLLAIPEYQVSLPGGTRPSQNDLFVLAKADKQLISIMVEGKASEPFGELVSDWFKDASSGKQKRLKFLCEELDLEIDKVSSIRYQLLHRTVSALIEAKQFNAQSALMLVQSFKENKDSFQDYRNFLRLFGLKAEQNIICMAGKKGKVNLYLGWVCDYGDYGFEAHCNMKGTITAKKCKYCGHHEIGITSDADEYIPLKPGMKAEINE